jgi:hypothetical protein
LKLLKLLLQYVVVVVVVVVAAAAVWCGISAVRIFTSPAGDCVC